MSTPDLSHLSPHDAQVRLPRPRNRLHGTVLAVKKDEIAAQVDMACGPYRIVSLMSREAADELDLKPGDAATAIVKSTTVFIESI